MIKLLALDLDGTLLNSDKQVSRENKEALAAARAKGVKVVITTGRPLMSIDWLFDELDMKSDEDYSITFNGGLVQKNTGDILSKKSFSLTELKDIHELTKSLGIPLSILSDDTVYQLDGPSMYENINPKLKYIYTTIDQLSEDGIYNKAISATDADLLDKGLNEIPDEYKEKYEMFKSRDIVLEFMPKGVLKSYGLAQLIEILGLKQDQVMAIGDEENDLAMIEWAGTGLAMNNAVNKLKEQADGVIPLTNDEHGIAWAIEKYILG